MNNFKFHIGFPVDTCSPTKYYLLYPSENNSHYLVKAGEDGKIELKDRHEPEGLSFLKGIIRSKYFTFYRKGGEKRPCGGTSSALAFAIAGLIDKEKVAEIKDIESPVFLFSGSFQGKPKNIDDLTLKDVTGKDIPKAKESLKNKWDAVEELKNDGRKVILFLHNEDVDFLRSISGENIPAPIIMEVFTDTTDQEKFFWNSIDLKSTAPELFSLKDSDFGTLAKSLGIDFYFKENLYELFIKIDEECKGRGVSVETVKETMRILEKISSEEKNKYLKEISKFHIEAAKTYSHIGDFENIKTHLGLLDSILYSSTDPQILNKRPTLLLEAAVIHANALADTKRKANMAYGEIEDALNDYNLKDVNYWKAMSAKGHIGRLAKKYRESYVVLKQVVENIDRSEVLQPKIHLISVLARINKFDEAIRHYKETEMIIKSDDRCADKEKSLEFLRVAGCEIVLSSKLNKRKDIYKSLEKLPCTFEDKKMPREYHNLLFIHYKYLIENSIGNGDKYSKKRDGFYLYLAKKVGDAVTRNRITLVTLIQMAMITTYLHVFNLKNKPAHKKIIEMFPFDFPGQHSLPQYNKIYPVSREMYMLLKSGKVPNKKQLNGFIEETMYMIGEF